MKVLVARNSSFTYAMMSEDEGYQRLRRPKCDLRG
jgi:hypothetical protein